MKKITKLKIEIKKALGLELNEKEDICIHKRQLGNEGCAWTIASDYIHAEDIVYSFGIGTDISFDRQLIQYYGVNVYAFDPTPKSIHWLKNQELPEKFYPAEFALAEFDGEIMLAPPPKSTHVSYRVISQSDQSNAECFPSYKLSTLMQMNNHDHISIVKMDIEGAEIAVIKNIIDEKIPIEQLLIEFHHRFETNGLERVRDAVRMLKEKGNYLVFHISESCEEISFIHREAVIV